MTTDERLDRLAERTDAIAQSVELLTSLHKDLENLHKDLEQQTARRFAETLQFINRLAHVAEAHEHRLDDLEGRQ